MTFSLINIVEVFRPTHLRLLDPEPCRHPCLRHRGRPCHRGRQQPQDHRRRGRRALLDDAGPKLLYKPHPPGY